MAKRRRARPARKRVGRVSFYLHHGAWWIYYRDGEQPVRKRVAEEEAEAERIAAQINAQLAASSPTLLTFQPVSVRELRQRFLEHHEQVLRSSLNTVRRYRAATQHLVEFTGATPAHQVSAHRFALHLRSREVSPNGHPHTAKRPLRDKGVQFILEVCRSMYAFAQRMRHLPPYAANPFSELRVERMHIEDAKAVFVFDAVSEHDFLRGADDWAFPVHFVLAKTGLRPGELTHLLVEDVDLDAGWLHVRNKPELGWKVKTRSERSVPLIAPVQRVLAFVIASRSAGLVFRRPRFAAGDSSLAGLTRHELAAVCHERQDRETASCRQPLTREQQQRIARSVWRDAGALKPDRVRISFIRIAEAAGLQQATCPKSWRHSFATLLQDANVDPLIRQITLGHKPAGAGGELGMTGIYTHTRSSTQRREIERALRLWPQSLEYAESWLNTHGGASC